MQTAALWPMWFKPWARPTRVVDLPSPSGDGAESGAHLASRFGVDVPHDLAVDGVDADVDDGCSVAEQRAREEAWMAGRHHHDLGVLDMMAEVGSSPVTDRHGRVLADEQE